ncbi:MAG TPA: DNA polymerase IV [Acidimicrobiales bacterium]|nr:DNA polymerase IV [Acidimicrobiales bacterium]
MLHLDMDAFYVSVELLRRPELVGLPVVVGGDGPRGVVAAASYEARSYGVRSAIPSTRARKLCPEAVFLPGDHSLYAEYSSRIHEILGRVTPLIEPIALDEAFLDVSHARRLHGSGREIALHLRRTIHEETGLTCSVGVATKKLIAKLASEAAKPRVGRKGPRPGRGVVVVTPDRELRFLHGHKVRDLWGVGPRTHEKLAELGVVTVGDLSRVPEDRLTGLLGRAHGSHLAALARGEDPRPVEPERRVKSVGHEETFRDDIFEAERLHSELVRMADAVATRLRRAGLVGSTVQIKVRYRDFKTISRARTVSDPIDTGPGLVAAARPLLEEIERNRGVRLLGLSVSGFDRDLQGSLGLDDQDLADRRRIWRDTAEALDEIRARFGVEAIGPGASLGRRGPGHDRWGPGSNTTTAG